MFLIDILKGISTILISILALFVEYFSLPDNLILVPRILTLVVANVLNKLLHIFIKILVQHTFKYWQSLNLIIVNLVLISYIVHISFVVIALVPQVIPYFTSISLFVMIIYTLSRVIKTR
jgi:hypothetical protein